MQILIFGMHRTGTSMVTRLVNLMGAYFGPEGSALAFKDENPKGFWERKDVLALNDALLTAHNCTWSDLKTWPHESGVSNTPPLLKTKIGSLVQGMDAFRPWVLKDPRLCLVFKEWRPCLEAPIAVIVHRNPVEIALSLQKRNGFPLEYGVALWEHYAVNALNNTIGLPRIFVRFVDFHQRPTRTCEYLYEQLVGSGVRRITMPLATEIRAFVDPLLYRSKPQSTPEYVLTDTQKIIAEMMRGDRPQEGTLRVSEASKLIMQSGLP